MKRIHLIALLLAFSLGAFAATGTVNGKVSGIPAPKALPGAFPPPPTPAIVFAVPLGAKPGLAHKTYVVDQQWTQFKPGVLAIPLGATVLFKNNDTVTHNVMWHSIGGNRSLGKNLGNHPPGQSISYHFTHAGAVHIRCLLHPGMNAWIYVTPTSYAVVTKTSGQYILKNLPEGRYRITVWHPGFHLQSKVVTVGDHTGVNFTL